MLPPSPSARWILYSRSECHLCDYAANILSALEADFVQVDIDSKSSLVERYGLRVPVIADRAGMRELYFPFEPEDVAAFIATRPE